MVLVREGGRLRIHSSNVFPLIDHLQVAFNISLRRWDESKVSILMLYKVLIWQIRCIAYVFGKIEVHMYMNAKDEYQLFSNAVSFSFRIFLHYL